MATNDHITSTIEIPITQGQIAIIDATDYELVSQHKWHIRVSSHTYYAVYRTRINGVYTATAMHRLICDAPKDTQIDHKNGNGLDNRRCNLRFATKSENAQNMRISEGASSIYKGVHWFKQTSKWQVSIMHQNKSYHLGYYSDEIVAAQVYDAKARELFGEFARLNFPERSIT